MVLFKNFSAPAAILLLTAAIYILIVAVVIFLPRDSKDMNNVQFDNSSLVAKMTKFMRSKIIRKASQTQHGELNDARYTSKNL